MESKEVINALGALAQPSRLSIFRMLVEGGSAGIAAGDIARALDLPGSSLSFHLNDMMRAGVIKQRRESRSLIYSANFGLMNGVVQFLNQACCQPEPGGQSAGGNCGNEDNGCATVGITVDPGCVEVDAGCGTSVSVAAEAGPSCGKPAPVSIEADGGCAPAADCGSSRPNSARPRRC
jgi:ArsR family transcriptional regulator